MNAERRFSQAISEGDGISLIARVSAADDAARIENQGAEAVLVTAWDDGALAHIRDATNLPVLLAWPSGGGGPTPQVDACLLDVGDDLDALAALTNELGGTYELAFRIDDEDRLEEAFEELDPEIVVLAAPDVHGEEALERVLDLLPDVPAGKLAIAEVSGAAQEEVGALERAGFDGVIVDAARLAQLAVPPQYDDV